MPAKTPIAAKAKAKSTPKSRPEDELNAQSQEVAPDVVETQKAPEPKAAEPKQSEEQPISMDQYMDEVRQRAHEIYLERGDRPGTPLGDWLQAEREIKARHNIKG